MIVGGAAVPPKRLGTCSRRIRGPSPKPDPFPSPDAKDDGYSTVGDGRGPISPGLFAGSGVAKVIIAPAKVLARKLMITLITLGAA